MSDAALARVERCLATIEALNPTLRSLITVLPEEARDAARRVDADIAVGRSGGPLHGVIVSVKDNIDTAGNRTTSGSKFFTARIATHDAEVVVRLRRAGAVIIGKANLHEFAFGGTTQNPHHGDGRNAWDVNAIPGGSSGGSASSVASGMCEASLGTDTGGSIRIPAALNGLAGLRPTAGRVPNTGSTPVSLQFDTIGPLAYRVSEVAAVYEAIAGYDRTDASSEDRPVTSWAAAKARGVAGLRVGVPRAFFRDGIDSELEVCLVAAERALSDLGVSMIDVEIAEADAVHAAMTPMLLADAAAFHRQRLENSPELFGADVRERLMMGYRATGLDYADGVRFQQRWIRRVQQVFDRVDVVLTPTVGFGAPKADDSREMIEATRNLTRFTFCWSFARVPALTVPCGFTLGGLPLGMQLVGPHWSEARLLALGDAYQGVTRHHLRRPG